MVFCNTRKHNIRIRYNLHMYMHTVLLTINDTYRLMDNHDCNRNVF